MTKRSYIFIFFTLSLIKIILLLLIHHFIGSQLFGGGNDSDYYHQYALGLRDDAVNIWPVILRKLNELSLYSRSSITWLLTFLGIIVVPIFTAKLVVWTKITNYNQRKDYWLVMVMVAAYPALFFQVTDLYRDIFMLFVFLLFLYCCRILSQHWSFLIFICGLGLSYFLYELRPYLGMACMVSLLITPLYSFRRFPFFLFILLYLFSLTLVFHLGYLDRIVFTYREIFDRLEGGSNLGIRFSDTTSFLPLFLLSWIYQLAGLYFPNVFSVFVFLLESTLFIYATIYIIINKKYANKFISYLVIFFVVYQTVWLLGNDNLGSAIRLRIFNYIVVLIAFFIVRAKKREIANLINQKT